MFLNNADFLDQHTIIYGHNMKNGSMFGQLKKYESLDFLTENICNKFVIAYAFILCYYIGKERHLL